MTISGITNFLFMTEAGRTYETVKVNETETVDETDNVDETETIDEIDTVIKVEQDKQSDSPTLRRSYPSIKDLQDFEIEEITLEVFAKLQLVVNGQIRQMKVGVKNDSDDADIEELKRSLKMANSHASSMFRPHHVLSALGFILSGYEIFTNKLSLNTSKQVYSEAVGAWLQVENYYESDFTCRVKLIQTKTSELLVNRRDCHKYMFYQRCVLYALTIFAAIGAITKKHHYKVIGLAGSAITFLFMTIYYGANSFIQHGLTMDLTKLIKKTYKEASSNRSD